MLEKLAQIEKTHEELTQRLSDPAVLTDRKVYAETNKALSEISPLVGLYRESTRVQRQRTETAEMLDGMAKDDDLFEMAREEREQLDARLADIEERLRLELIPKDPNDQ